MLGNFSYSNPTKLYFGDDALSFLPQELNNYGPRVMLTYGGGSIKKTGLYDTVMDILSDEGFTVTECGGIEPNPRIESVERGVKLCKENGVGTAKNIMQALHWYQKAMESGYPEAREAYDRLAGNKK